MPDYFDDLDELFEPCDNDEPGYVDPRTLSVPEQMKWLAEARVKLNRASILYHIAGETTPERYRAMTPREKDQLRQLVELCNKSDPTPVEREFIQRVRLAIQRR